MIESLRFEIDVFARLARTRLAHNPGYAAVQKIPGIGLVLATLLVAEIGDITHFAPQCNRLAGRG